MWTTGRVWAVVRLPQIGCQDDLCERACWGGQGQGAGFSGRMSLWLLVDKVFAFLFSKLRRKRSTLWFMVEWDFSHPWASENSGEAGMFSDKSLHIKNWRDGVSPPPSRQHDYGESERMSSHSSFSKTRAKWWPAQVRLGRQSLKPLFLDSKAARDIFLKLKSCS